jgi:hypothetical protein
METAQALVTRVQFKFDGSLGDGVYRFLAWRGDVLRPVDLPPVGESILVN